MRPSNGNSILSVSLKPVAALIFNLILAYIVYFIARVTYLFENFGFFSEGLTAGHLAEMFRGSLMFDTTAIVYSNALYVLLMLFPLWFKETEAYHRFCRILLSSPTVSVWALTLPTPFIFRSRCGGPPPAFSGSSEMRIIYGESSLRSWSDIGISLSFSWL